MSDKRLKHYKRIHWLLFIVYMILLLYMLFFAEQFGRQNSDRIYSYNLVPFQEIKRFIGMWKHEWYRPAVILNLVGNVAVFMPFGYFTATLYQSGKHWYTSILYTFLLSLSIETVQLIFRVGSFDVDDIILNVTGGFLGFLVFVFWQKRKRRT